MEVQGEGAGTVHRGDDHRIHDRSSIISGTGRGMQRRWITRVEVGEPRNAIGGEVGVPPVPDPRGRLETIEPASLGPDHFHLHGGKDVQIEGVQQEKR